MKPDEFAPGPRQPPWRPPFTAPLDRLEADMACHLLMFQPDEAGLYKRARGRAQGNPRRGRHRGCAAHLPPQPGIRHGADAEVSPARSRAGGQGFIAMLPLKLLGLQHLALGTPSTAPTPMCACSPIRASVRPAFTSLGHLCSGPLALGMALFAERMSQGLYAGVDIYSRPVTDAGVRFHEGAWDLSKAAPSAISRRRTSGNSGARRSNRSMTPYVPRIGQKNIGITVAYCEDLIASFPFTTPSISASRNVHMKRNMARDDLACPHPQPLSASSTNHGLHAGYANFCGFHEV